MRGAAKSAYWALVSAGLDPIRLTRAVRNLPRYLSDWRAYQLAIKRGALSGSACEVYPVLTDYDEPAGQARGHYFFQDLWAARKILARRPASHLDIGSRIDGFVAHLLVFMPVQVVDVRPLPQRVEGLSFVQADATSLRTVADDSVESLSSLHAVEHFGLGRYGDRIDPDACYKGMRAMARVLRPGGYLYFSVPIGRARVAFNAHRVFAPTEVAVKFPRLRLVSFAAVDDRGEFVPDGDPSEFAQSEYALGLFEFTKPA